MTRTMPRKTYLILNLLILLASVLALFAYSAWKRSLQDYVVGEILSSAETRSYLLYVPDAYDPQTPIPLVISIHGYAEWPAHQAYTSRWNELADKEGFLVVYPSGTDFPKRWRTTGLPSTRGTSEMDLRFISDLIDQLEANYNIDPARIYANGLSNGGGMSYLLACQMADRIAAVGGVAGAYTYPLEQCHPSRPVPLIAFHGDADPVVPYRGGPSRSFDIPFPPVPDWMNGWAERNQCARKTSISQVSEVFGVHYEGCSQDAEVIFYTIQGGGHTWPGGNPLPAWLVGTTSQTISATELMWEFFIEHSLVH